MGLRRKRKENAPRPGKTSNSFANNNTNTKRTQLMHDNTKERLICQAEQESEGESVCNRKDTPTHRGILQT